MPDEMEIRKRRAAAEHTAWVAEQAEASIADLERKVDKARADLGAARDQLENAKHEAKAARREADERAGDLGEIEPGPVVEAHAQPAVGGAKASGKQG